MSKPRATAPKVRCAIYTRKSTEEGLDQDFNSLDAQRESGGAYIKSQAHEGWVCLEERFDDGGFTGGNMDRPALQQLMAMIEAGQIDCVVVYKVDRLSRSLLDFARMMEIFERHKVSFVSVTQQFNTATSMGRLILNVLLSFAQFEREMISERTRDKIAAARRKGKWSGGMPLLGYDVVDRKLVVNEAEAAQVREIFSLYIERKSLLSVVQELERRRWTSKTWTTKKGTVRKGRRFNKTALHQLLTNVTYIGKVRHKKSVYEGEHLGIVAPELFEAVQAALRANAGARVSRQNTEQFPLLRGLLRCAACDCAMINSYASRGTNRYRYYLCTNAQKRGWDACPAPSVPAREIEQFVVEQLRSLAHDTSTMGSLSPIQQSRLATVESTWDLQSPREQTTTLHELLAELSYDATRESVAITFRQAEEELATSELDSENEESTCLKD